MPLFAIPFPVIDPVVISVGPLAIRWYALAYVAGLVLGWLAMRKLCEANDLWAPSQKRPSVTDLDDLLVYAALGVVLGGRIGHVLFYGFDYYRQNPLEILQVWRGGMAFHGGLIGVLLAIALFAYRRGLSTLTVLDLFAVVAPIGLFFGRMANFINQELWGRPTDVPWAFIFPRADDLPRHPSQIYEALTEGVLLLIVVGFVARRTGFRRPGLLAGVFAIGYALARSFCEFFRQPDDSEVINSVLTMGMVLSTPMLVAGIALLINALRRPALEPAAP
ncbi:prolipoprotein diacylglyceryl transferase [Alsobacter metallidurans]|uniref:Phosphatidylglycerol--prolipoprotein diacylglyceryl transferase n=1 Tax=Alsobacter metallidurans TaxID=340221 RepID=A0A917ML94_9HYPH|nr:prolipoprotein diacylglyceryl transferase [Alsobacter metallidurans]GGH28589.1 prolipoprotein diacylglyceryl transferase [Alsobacter metallidurans]